MSQAHRTQRSDAECPEPVFVIGCQRSGTTMLGSMLGSHPDGFAIPEARFVADLAPPKADEDCKLAAIIDQIETQPQFIDWAFDLEGARPEGHGRFSDAVRWLVSRYSERCGVSAPRYWVDHAPTHTKRVARLLVHFPKAKFVHIIRDGRAVAASVLPLEWGPNSVRDAAQMWMVQLAQGLAARRLLPERSFHELRYEDLLEDPETHLREIAAKFELEFHPQMMTGDRFRVPQVTKGYHALVGSTPDRKRIDAWRTALTPREIELFEANVGDLLPYLGYQLVNARPKGMNLRERATTRLRGIWRDAMGSRAFRKLRERSAKEAKRI